jgi:hypothetical protein
MAPFQIQSSSSSRQRLWEARRLAAFAASAATAATFPDQTAPRIFASSLDSAALCYLTIGEPHAMYTDMLRITLPSTNGLGIFVLEGRLAGLWAQELTRVAREANQGPGAIFDLQEVFYVDSTGEDALRMLSRVGARFITDSAYGKDLCKRLRLLRIAAPEMRDSQQGVQGDAHCGGRLPNATKADPSGADVSGQQHSGCRE